MINCEMIATHMCIDKGIHPGSLFNTKSGDYYLCGPKDYSPLADKQRFVVPAFSTRAWPLRKPFDVAVILTSEKYVFGCTSNLSEIYLGIVSVGQPTELNATPFTLHTLGLLIQSLSKLELSTLFDNMVCFPRDRAFCGDEILSFAKIQMLEFLLSLKKFNSDQLELICNHHYWSTNWNEKSVATVCYPCIEPFDYFLANNRYAEALFLHECPASTFEELKFAVNFAAKAIGRPKNEADDKKLFEILLEEQGLCMKSPWNCG